MSNEYVQVLHENLDKGIQIRLVVSDFRELEYIHFRKYFLDMDGNWVPSKEGVSMPLTISGVTALCYGIAEVLSATEFNNILLKVNEEKQRNSVPGRSE